MSLTTRAWVLARFVVAPLGPLAAEVQGLEGRMLSLGPGLCIIERYLCELNPQLRIEGVDLDPSRVDTIRSTGARSPRMTARLGDATDLHETSTYDAVLVCDAFHHFPAERHAPLAQAIARALKPGGVCIVKDLDVEPVWKERWNRLHDRLVAGPEPIRCRPPEELAKFFADAGMAVERAERTDHRLTPYAHYIIRARRPAADSDPVPATPPGRP